MPDSTIVSGYCKCGFPASVRCPRCLAKLCGNCFPLHKCAIELVEPKPVKVEHVEDNQSEAVQNMTRKPGRPKVRK